MIYGNQGENKNKNKLVETLAWVPPRARTVPLEDCNPTVPKASSYYKGK